MIITSMVTSNATNEKEHSEILNSEYVGESMLIIICLLGRTGVFYAKDMFGKKWLNKRFDKFYM